MLWRNGLGSTLEIARDTPAGEEDWGWRVSLADVAQSGAFSPFAGMTRIISVIEGAGMVLNIDGAPAPELGCWEPLVFSGDAQVHCQLLDGPVRDFNLIYHADRYQADLTWLRVEGQLQIDAPESCIVFCAQGALDVHAGHEHAALGTLDALRIEAGQVPSLLALQGSAHVCLISLQALGPA